jgi:hypothetical protein
MLLSPCAAIITSLLLALIPKNQYNDLETIVRISSQAGHFPEGQVFSWVQLA